MLASFSGNGTMDKPVNHDDLMEMQDQYGASIPNAVPNIPEGLTPRSMHPTVIEYHNEIPEFWTVEDYDIITDEGDGTYSSTPNSYARLYRDQDGYFVGLDTPMRSYQFSRDEDGLARAKEILDRMQEDGKTIIQFRGRIENPRNPNNLDRYI